MKFLAILILNVRHRVFKKIVIILKIFTETIPQVKTKIHESCVKTFTKFLELLKTIFFKLWFANLKHNRDNRDVIIN